MRPILTWPVTLATLAVGSAMTIVGGFGDQLLAAYWRGGLVAGGFTLIVTGGLSVFPAAPDRNSPSAANFPAAGDQVRRCELDPSTDLFAGLRLSEDQAVPSEVQLAPTEMLVDLDTGELVGDRVARLEERMATVTSELVDLAQVVQDQSELTAKAFGTLRREVERIGHVFGGDHDG